MKSRDKIYSTNKMEQRVKKEKVEKTIVENGNGYSSVSNKRKNNSIIVIVAFLCLVLGVIVGWLITVLISDKDSNEDLNTSSNIEIEQQTDQEIEEQSQQQSEQPTANKLDYMVADGEIVINTPLAKLHYPEQWKDHIQVNQVEGDVLAIQFFAVIEGKEEVHIFDIVFGGEEGFNLGYIKTEDNTQVSVNVVSYDIDLGDGWTEEKMAVVYTMAEDVNYTIEKLQSEEGFVSISDTGSDIINSSEVAVEEVGEDFVLLDTSIGQLYYSGEWSGAVSTEEIQVSEGFAAEVYGETESGRVKLYTLYIGSVEEADFCIGAVNGVKVSFTMEEINVVEWPQEDQWNIYGMQEDINYIIQQVTEMPGFSELWEEDTALAENNEDVLEDYLLLETPIGELYYPAIWKEKVTAEILPVTQGYAAVVYGLTESGRMKLYTLYIGTETTIGTFLGSVNGNSVSVSMTKPVMINWPKEDQEAIYDMHDDVNYIFEQIYNMPGYSEE